MVSLFARRVTLSAYRSSATYSRILPSSASVHCDRGIPGTSLHTGPVRKFPNSQRNASTSATATTDEIKSTTTGRKEPVKKLTPKQQEAQKRRAEMAAALAKRKEAATLLLKHLTEKEEKLAKAEAKEGRAYIVTPCSHEMSYSAIFVACTSYQTSSEVLGRILAVSTGDAGGERFQGDCRQLAQSL